MKRLLLPLLCSLACAACMDRDYDLGNIETGDIAIGSDDSRFEIPLATVRVAAADLSDGTADIRTMLDKADTWLPSALPDGAASADLTRLGESAYTDRLFDALLAEMRAGGAKLDAVTDLIYADCRTQFAPLLGVSASNEALFKTTFKAAVADARQEVLDETKAQFRRFLASELHFEPLHYDIGRIDLSDDVVDMLADNLDPAGTADPKNTLHLAGTIDNRLPLSARLSPKLLAAGNPRLDFGVDIEAADDTNPIDPSERTRLFAEDLRALVTGMQVEIPLQLLRYYPRTGFAPAADETLLTIRLHFVKCGALKLDL